MVREPLNIGRRMCLKMPRIAEMGEKNRLVSAAKSKKNSTGACLSHIVVLFWAVLLLSLSMTGNAMDYYSGHQYTFSTPYNSNWEYSWYASCCSDSTQPCCYDPTNIKRNTLIFTAPIVDKPTEITISVVVRDKALPTCMEMGELKIIIRPLAGISIVKNHFGGDGVFPFEGTGFLPGAGKTSFSLGPTNDYTFAWTSLNAGTYSITELVPDGWDLDTITVTGTDASNYQITGNKIMIAYQTDESPVITFIDKKRSSLTVIKSTLGGDDAFNFVGTGFKTGNSLESFKLMNGQSVSDLSLSPGTAYTITEESLNGWDLSSITIMGTDAANYKITGRSITITPQPGESIAVTFTNTKRGSIIVDKVTRPADDTQSFDFSGSWGGTSGTKFSLTDTAMPYESGYLVPGDYVICESAPPSGWTLTEISVAGAASYQYGDGTNWHASFDAATDTCVKIALGAGQSPVVTFTDAKKGSITVTKETIDGDDTFSFTGIAPPTSLWPADCGLNSFSLSNGQSASCSDLVPGTYTISEAEFVGWSLDDIEIVDPDGGSIEYPATRAATIDLDSGEAIAVKFTNAKLEVCSCTLKLNKTTENDTIERGQDIVYHISLCNNCSSEDCSSGVIYRNVTLWDVLPKEVVLLSAEPMPSSMADALRWDIGTLGPNECFKVDLWVRHKQVDINYDMEQGVSGQGFVNVHNDYDTHRGPDSITNCAYASADLIKTLKSCASTKIGDPHTELKRREFGSGTYASKEVLSMRTENDSIKSTTSLSAVHQPTTFSLPHGSSITYGSKWTEKTKGINTATGATLNEEYAFASKIEKERDIELDENGSTMKTDVAFTGTGHIGVLEKEDLDSHPKVDPTYEATEDYTGSFRVYELVDEYGSNIRSDKNVTGYGYAAVDKRVSDNQRTYESGTGSYQSDEKIETASNYIAKDINLVYGPTNYSYTHSFTTNQNLKWSEGMWSKSGVLAGGVILAAWPASGCGGEAPANTSAPASYISERYSSLDYLKKETSAKGLNEMNINASFSGMADFRAKATYSNKTGEIDDEERYLGAYDITRKIQIIGVSKYGRPHITVTKEGNMTTKWFNKTMANVAEFNITIVNDGNVALAPINIRDIFPPGTEYISSSIRPDSSSNVEANWSLMNLGIGNSIQLDVMLNVTTYAPANVVNRVMVCGMNGDEGCVSGSAYYAIESGKLPFCPTEVVVDKTAEIDETDPTLIHYAIVLKNNDNATVAATLMDILPAGLIYLGASDQPDRQEGQSLKWIVPDLKPGDVSIIEYQARASMDGIYVNTVHMDASSIDGVGYGTADASIRVYISSTGVAPQTTRYGYWQPPNWNFTTPDQGITIDLSPDDDVMEIFPTMYRE